MKHLGAGVVAVVLASCLVACSSEADQPAKGEFHEMLPEEIQQSGELTIGGSTSVAPYLFEKDGKVVGFEKEFIDELARILEVDVSLQDTGFDALVPSLQSGRIDVAMGDFTDTKERQAAVDFVDYTKSFQGLLVQKGNPEGITTTEDLCGKTVAGAQGSLSLELAEQQDSACAEEGESRVDILPMEDAGSSTLQVQSGRADAVVIDFVIARYVSDKGGKTEVAGEPLYPQFHGAAVTKGDEEMVDALSAAFEELMQDGAYDKILKKWDLAELAMNEPVVNAAKE